MTYRELLELYKKNELDDNKKTKVEADIERQEAINDYLYEEAELTKMNYTFDQDNISQEDENALIKQEREFTKMIKRSIRGAFLRMGIIVGVFVLMAILFIQLALPRIVSSFYYNPGKEIAVNTTQMSLDMAVYTELTMPGYVRSDVIVGNKGYGDYDICINQKYSYNGMFKNLSGKVEKGKLTLYDTNVLKRPVSNAFAWFQIQGDRKDSLKELIGNGHTNMSAAGNASDALEALQKLDENTKYVAYITLDKIMTYEHFISVMQGWKSYLYSAWCAVCTNESMNMLQNIGFQYGLSNSTFLNWDREKYPELLLWDEASQDDESLKVSAKNLRDEEFMKIHFVSMLRYMSEQKEFLTMMKDEADIYSDAADYVEKNGLNVYGFAGIADKSTLLDLSNMDEVYEIYTQPLK